MRFGAKLGQALRAIVTIVSPETLRRWIREEKSGRVPKKRGRKRKPLDVRKLVIKLARENGWGYTRFLGELKKLGVKAISRNTVKRILREEGYETGPKRGPARGTTSSSGTLTPFGSAISSRSGSSQPEDVAMPTCWYSST